MNTIFLLLIAIYPNLILDNNWKFSSDSLPRWTVFKYFHSHRWHDLCWAIFIFLNISMYSGSLGLYEDYQLLYKLYQCTIYYCAKYILCKLRKYNNVWFTRWLFWAELHINLTDWYLQVLKIPHAFRLIIGWPERKFRNNTRLVTQSCSTCATPWPTAHQASLFLTSLEGGGTSLVLD